MAQAILEALSEGTLFCNRYKIVRVIDAGGMGVVYEVVDERTKRTRALKTIHPGLAANPEIRARFALEATATAGVRSDHLVEVFDSGLDEDSGMPYLVMELLEGDNLGAVLKRQGRCAPTFVVACLQQIAWALEKMHEVGVVHRDLKPENLILALRDDGSPKIKIIDFGIVKVVAQGSAAPTTRNVGTPCYMSPEQIRGDGRVDKAADLYALGHIAYTLLTGQAYWETEPCYQQGPVPLLARILRGGNRERATERARRGGASLPATFDAWFDRATADAPRERHASATQLVEELAAALDVPLPSRNLRAPDDPASARRPRRRMILSISVGAILLLTLALVVTHSRRVVSTDTASSKLAGTQDPPPISSAVVAPRPSEPAAASALPPNSSASSIGLAVPRPRTRRQSPTVNAISDSAQVTANPNYDPTDER